MPCRGLSVLWKNLDNLKGDELVKSLVLLAPKAILGFMTRLAKLQALGLTPSNSLQFLTPDAL